MMNFQPLNSAHLMTGQTLEEGEISYHNRKRIYEDEAIDGFDKRPRRQSQRRKRIYEDEAIDGFDKRPRRQSQRRSPKVHSGEPQQSDSDDIEGENIDNADAEWVPGAKQRRYRGRQEQMERGKVL